MTSTKQFLRVLLISFLILFAKGVHAQPFPPTTEEEFNMGVVGYKLYLQMGVSLVKGYTVKDINSYEYGERKAEFKGLYRPGDAKPCAVIMMYTRLRGAPEYYCIPTPDADEVLWDRYRHSLAGETDSKQEQLQFFGFALAKGLMYFATK